MATAVLLCHNCQEAKYHCLSCPASVHVCSTWWSECYIPAPKETPNWKAGSRVAFCMTGGKNTASEKPDVKRKSHRKAEMHKPKITQKRDIHGHGWLGWRRERQNYQKLEWTS